MAEAPPRALPGIRIGHASDYGGLTGCTVVLCERGAVCGVDVRGSAAGTRELAACEAGHIVERIHAILLTGGSAFGLDAATGVMEYLERRGVGFPVGAGGRLRIPIVPAAVIFDLNIGSATARPSSRMARRACQNASTVVAEGSVGVGTGATVGKLFGVRQATKGGVGFASLTMARGIKVQALAVVNAFGDVVDPSMGEVVAGARAAPDSSRFVRTEEQMMQGVVRKSFGNTTLVVVMTNAQLGKLEATKVAQMAHDGLARTIRPVHTRFDGDLVFALSLGARRVDTNVVGTGAAEATARAILRGVRTAHSLGGVPSCADLHA